AALFTAYGASAASFLPHDAGVIAASTRHSRRLMLKGKRLVKYVAVLHPTKYDGQVIGDKAASGRVIVKAVRYSSTNYAIFIKVAIFDIKSGGKIPVDCADGDELGARSTPLHAAMCGTLHCPWRVCLIVPPTRRWSDCCVCHFCHLYSSPQASAVKRNDNSEIRRRLASHVAPGESDRRQSGFGENCCQGSQVL
ncbi:unnamed protein product, partial [Closterium sp. Naga37s-1]